MVAKSESSCPAVSVLMPVLNGISFVESSVNSILDQTFEDLEFVIVDDGSTDGTIEVLEAFAKHDFRVKVFHNPGPHGVANALNFGLQQCRARFVARQDADDLSFPQRLKHQTEFLEENPDISIVGSWIEMMDINGDPLRVHREPVSVAEVHFQSLFGTPFAHPAVLIRRQAFDHLAEEYREMPAQDYDLWSRMLRAGLRGANLPEVLVRYRVFPDSDSHVRAVEHSRMADEIAREHLESVLGSAPICGDFESPRCKQIAYALICGTQFDFVYSDYRLGDSVIELLNEITALPSVTQTELDLFRRHLASCWYPVRATLISNALLARGQNRIWRACKRVIRYAGFASYLFNAFDRKNFIENVPVIINTRDRVSDLRLLIDWLQLAGHRRIILLDNGSTFPPLCKFLDRFDGQVIKLGRNLGHTALWEVSDLAELIRQEWFVYTDPDVVPVSGTPFDAVAYFFFLLQKYPRYEKAGFGLKIDDLPDHFKLKEEVISWETQQYRKEIAPNVFEADIDTTFALYRPRTNYCYGPALRTRGLYEARHMPWYSDSERPTAEERFYREHALNTVTTWSGDCYDRIRD